MYRVHSLPQLVMFFHFQVRWELVNVVCSTDVNLTSLVIHQHLCQRWLWVLRGAKMKKTNNIFLTNSSYVYPHVYKNHNGLWVHLKESVVQILSMKTVTIDRGFLNVLISAQLRVRRVREDGIGSTPDDTSSTAYKTSLHLDMVRKLVKNIFHCEIVTDSCRWEIAAEPRTLSTYWVSMKHFAVPFRSVFFHWPILLLLFPQSGTSFHFINSIIFRVKCTPDFFFFFRSVVNFRIAFTTMQNNRMIFCFAMITRRFTLPNGEWLRMFQA